MFVKNIASPGGEGIDWAAKRKAGSGGTWLIRFPEYRLIFLLSANHTVLPYYPLGFWCQPHR